MVRLFIEAFGGMTIKDRSTKCRAFHRIAVAPPCAMPACQHKFKFPGAGFSEKSDGATSESFFGGIVLDLFDDPIGILFAMQFEENFAHHCLLISVEKFADRLFGDIPIIIDLRA